MKKFFTQVSLLLASLLATSNYTQAQFDLSDSLFYPDANSPIYENVDFTAYVQIRNTGITYPKDSAIVIDITLNGTMVGTSGPLNFAADFAAGGVSQLVPINIDGSVLFGLTAHAATLCAEIKAPGDNNSANNSDCSNITVTPEPTIDFGVTSVTVYVEGNAVAPGEDIEIGKAIDSAKVEITNFTNNPFAVGFPIRYQFNLGDSSVIFNAVTPGIAANGTTTRVLTNPIAFDGLPTVAGSYEICASTLVTNDATANNNSNCGTASEFNFVSPAGISETAIEEKYTIIQSQNNLTITQNEKHFNKLEIISITGQIVAEKSLKLTTQINLDNYNSGVYLVKLSGENNVTATQKIVLQKD